MIEITNTILDFGEAARSWEFPPCSLLGCRGAAVTLRGDTLTPLGVPPEGIGNRFVHLGYVHPICRHFFLSWYNFYILLRLADDNFPGLN
ncbi:hypothetical protein [Anabaena sp. WFMT]|uniref:hypothetical protein n=1 Tax=Anabaena sp. WFMT TaxID=3449730 RepID=UPI003F6A3AC4